MNGDMSHKESAFNSAGQQQQTLQPAPHMDSPMLAKEPASAVASQPQPKINAAAPGNGMSYSNKEEPVQFNEAFESSADEGPSDGRGMNEEGGMGHTKMNSEKTSTKVASQMNSDDAQTTISSDAAVGMNSNQ